MSNPKRSKRPDGSQRPKTRQQQQQEVNVYIYRRIDVMQKQLDAYGKVLGHMVQKMEMVSKLAQQMITTMVILNEKGLITNDEIAKKQAELMLPIDEQLAGLEDKVSGRASEVEGGSGKAVEGDAKETVNANATNSNSDTGAGASESGEVQSEEAGTVESDVGLQDSGLSDGESKGSNRTGDDREITEQSDVSPSIPAPIGTGDKAPYISLD